MPISKEVVAHVKSCTVAVGLDLGPSIHPKILGTGFLVNSKGYCLTNRHVAHALLTPVEYWHTIQISTRACIIGYKFIPGKGMVSARLGIKSILAITGKDVKPGEVHYGGIPDVAVLSTEWDNSPFIEISQECVVPEGNEVYFCGYPLGEEMFFEEEGGVKQVEQITSLLQRGIVSAHLPCAGIDNPHGFKIDATCNPGNSGSPVISEDGKAVGIVYAKRTEAFTYAASIKDFKVLIEEAIKRDLANAPEGSGKIEVGKQYSPPKPLQSEIVEALKKGPRQNIDPFKDLTSL